MTKIKLYTTEVRAICPITKELKSFVGPNVPGTSFEDATNYCQTNGYGYLEVTGELVAEIPCKPGTLEPDWSKMIDYENIDLSKTKLN